MDTEGIVAMILRHRPDLSREDVLRMAREKMKSIGAGYLTEQGALFLVASDLGIRVDEEIGRMRMVGVGATVALKDLYSGARDVSIVARVMKIYPVRRYSKGDGTSLVLRRLVVYDNDRTMGLNLWDDAADAIERLGIVAGDAIMVSRAYVKSGLNGSLVINTGMRSSVELVSVGGGTGLVEIRGLEDIALDVGYATEGDNLVVTGTLCSNPTISTYSNRDGELSRVMSMLLQGSTARRVRVVVWDLNYANLAKIVPINSRVMVTGVRVRHDGDRIELHGDAGSVIKALGDHGNIGYAGSTDEGLGLMRLSILAVSSAGAGAGGEVEYSIDGSSSMGDGVTTTGRYAIVTVEDYSGKTRRVYLLDTSSLRRVSEGMIIECIPSRLLGYTIYLDEDSYIGGGEEQRQRSKAAIHEPTSKIADVGDEEQLYIIEAIVLTAPRVDEMRLRDGSMRRRAEALVGDDTREARLIAWDRQVESIESLRVGERIRLYGVTARRRPVMVRRDGTGHGMGDDSMAEHGYGGDAYELNVRPFTIVRRIG
ncbi:MAG: hypothetical protein NZ888_03215 [Candidatus Nitrosocaldus sp.]|nr:hypothetical protein [Candidatus Nitrosocaldus sp.]MDW8000215.1 hypothetical protein [Candidatus Nitrosocaldus sp.]